MQKCANVCMLWTFSQSVSSGLLVGRKTIDFLRLRGFFLRIWLVASQHCTDAVHGSESSAWVVVFSHDKDEFVRSGVVCFSREIEVAAKRLGFVFSSQAELWDI